MDDWAKERARAALRFPRPCKCFEEGTLDQLPACRDGLCADAVRSIAAALQQERERCAAIADAEAAEAKLARLENPDEALVEAVAKAIYEADPEGGYYEDDPSSYWMAEGFSEHVWTIWRATARAAIRALARILAETDK